MMDELQEHLASNWLSDCDGDFYFASLHTGATAWFVLASLHENPFSSSSGDRAGQPGPACSARSAG
jgi:hypothetical protein